MPGPTWGVSEMDTEQTILVPGPPHPDLFDGETPTMVPAPTMVRAFLVTVSYSVRRFQRSDVEVIAASEEEACRLAVAKMGRDAGDYDGDEEADDFEADDVEELERGPTRDELYEWWDHQEAAS